MKLKGGVQVLHASVGTEKEKKLREVDKQNAFVSLI